MPTARNTATGNTATENSATCETMPYWLASLDADELAELMARRPDVLVPMPSSLVELADRLAAPQSVRLVVHGFDRTRVDMLAAAQSLHGDPTVDSVAARFEPPVDRARVADTLAELCRFGLMWPADGETFRLVRPLHGTGGRGNRPIRLHVEPPEPRLVSPGVDVLDKAAGAAALPTVQGVAQLVELCAVTPLATLRSGGVGVKEVRRAAKTLAASELSVRLWLTLAYHADLVDGDDGEIVPTAAADGWLAGTPAERLVPLLMTWWRLPSAPTAPDMHGKPPTALVHVHYDTDRQLRHDLIEWLASRRPGDALADRAELLATLCWRKPYDYGEPTTVVDTADAILREASDLGVWVDEGLSTWGRALVSGVEVLSEAVARVLPPATGRVRLQADLTAVVTGIPTAELSGLLDLAADAGERDTASVWRFSPTSVRRALAAGYTAAGLLAALEEVSSHALPQPLEYLVRDAERRHGELTVAPVGCCVLGDDPALLAEVAAHRGLGALGLRLLAPGVLASAASAAETLASLRKHGYAPVTVDGSGVPKVERVRPRRAKPRSRPTPSPTTRPVVTPPVGDLRSLAEELLAARVVEPEVPTSGPAAGVRQHGDHLSNRELTLLTDALEAEKPIQITYLDQNDRISSRKVTPLAVMGGLMEAWCHLREDERHFLISRIRGVDTPR
jgi:hypothetical protein